MKRCVFCNGCDIDSGGWCHGCERFNEALSPTGRTIVSSERNSYRTKEIRSLIGWRFEYTCNVCQTMFKTAHAAAFHTCDKVQRCAECRTGVLWHGVCPTCSPGLTQHGKDYARQLEEDEKAQARLSPTGRTVVSTPELQSPSFYAQAVGRGLRANKPTFEGVDYSALELRVAALMPAALNAVTFSDGRKAFPDLKQVPKDAHARFGQLFGATQAQVRKSLHGKPSDWYDPAAQRDARPKKYPAPTPLCLLKLWERRLSSLSTLAYVRATLFELREEIKRRER